MNAARASILVKSSSDVSIDEGGDAPQELCSFIDAFRPDTHYSQVIAQKGYGSSIV